MAELVHVSIKKSTYVKRSYGKRIQLFFLKVENLQGIVVHEREHVEWCIDPFESKAH